MSRTKKSRVPHYELLYIIPNQYTEDEAKAIAVKVAKTVQDLGGAITHQEDWGKKKLTYPIKGSGFGYYNLIEFDLVGQPLEAINKNLKLNTEVLRHQIVTKTVKTVEEIQAEKKRKEARVKEEVQKEQAAEDMAIEKAKAKDKDKVDLKDLDEKLDKILETDDLL